jgi:hypothetical protein
MYRKTITKSRAGHYALTIRLNGARVFHRALITNLTTAQLLAAEFIASHQENHHA